MSELPQISRSFEIRWDDVDGIGLHSCGVCGFEIEGPRDEPAHVADHRKLTATTTSTTTVAVALQPL